EDTSPRNPAMRAGPHRRSTRTLMIPRSVRVGTRRRARNGRPERSTMPASPRYGTDPPIVWPCRPQPETAPLHAAAATRPPRHTEPAAVCQSPSAGHYDDTRRAPEQFDVDLTIHTEPGDPPSVQDHSLACRPFTTSRGRTARSRYSAEAGILLRAV